MRSINTNHPDVLIMKNEMRAKVEELRKDGKTDQEIGNFIEENYDLPRYYSTHVDAAFDFSISPKSFAKEFE